MSTFIFNHDNALKITTHIFLKDHGIPLILKLCEDNVQKLEDILQTLKKKCDCEDSMMSVCIHASIMWAPLNTHITTKLTFKYRFAAYGYGFMIYFPLFIVRILEVISLESDIGWLCSLT